MVILVLTLLQYQNENKLVPLKISEEKDLHGSKKLLAPPPPISNRLPASLPNKKQTRKITNQAINMRTLLNSPPAANWEKRLARNLLKFQEGTTQVFFKKKGSYKKIIKGKEKIIEKVQIILKFKDGNKNSYHSLVDIKNGQIIYTWDRTIHENKKVGSFEIVPTGSL